MAILRQFKMRVRKSKGEEMLLPSRQYSSGKDKTSLSPYSKLSLALTLLAFSAVLAVFNTVHMFRHHTNPTSVNAETFTAMTAEPEIHVIISTECSTFQDWQAHVFMHAHTTVNFPGRVTRLVSCKDPTWTPPKSLDQNYEVIVTPMANPLNGDDYAPRNRPHALVHLFQERPGYIKDDELVLLMDPDQILLHKWTGFNVTEGKPAGAAYGQGTSYLKWAPKYCHTCDFSSLTKQQHADLAIGAPYIMYGKDLLRIVPRWRDILELIRSDEKTDSKGGWVSDMFAYSIASVDLGLIHRRETFMVSDVTSESEPWALAQGIPQPPLFVMHFCQKIKVNDYSWSKHMFRTQDFFDCANPVLFPEATGADAEWVLSNAFQPLGRSKSIPVDTVRSYRNAWAYFHTVPFANSAFQNYRMKFC